MCNCEPRTTYSGPRLPQQLSQHKHISKLLLGCAGFAGVPATYAGLFDAGILVNHDPTSSQLFSGCHAAGPTSNSSCSISNSAQARNS